MFSNRATDQANIACMLPEEITMPMFIPIRAKSAIVMFFNVLYLYSYFNFSKGTIDFLRFLGVKFIQAGASASHQDSAFLLAAARL